MMHLPDLAFLFDPTIPAAGTDNSKIALYGMIAALGTATIAGVFSVLNKIFGNKVDASSPAANIKRVAKQAEAMERFLLLQGIDPRRIKTGYETMEEVRRAPAS